MRSPVYTAECFWPIGHRINGVPLYIISTRDTCCCYIVVLIPVLNILGAVQLWIQNNNELNDIQK